MGAGPILRISFQENEAYASHPPHPGGKVLHSGVPGDGLAAGRHRQGPRARSQYDGGRSSGTAITASGTRDTAPSASPSRAGASPDGISASPRTTGPVCGSASNGIGVRSRSASALRPWASCGSATPPSIAGSTRSAGSRAPCGPICGRGIGSGGDGPAVRVRPRCGPLDSAPAPADRPAHGGRALGDRYGARR
jgi:hypothetical protein